jgi:hypothetical protein
MATSPAESGLSTDGRERGHLREAEEAPEETRRSAFGIVRDLFATLTRVVEDSTELFGATLREELERFRTETARLALSAVAASAGVCLLTAALAIFLSELVGWPLALLILGAAYLGLALVLQLGGRDRKGEPR